MRLLQKSVLAAAEVMADWIEQHLADAARGSNSGTLLLPTGSTPLPLYAALRKRGAAGGLNLEHWRSFNLDEYWPCAAEDATSFRSFMEREVFSPLELAPNKIGFLSGTVPEEDLAAHCEAYERDIVAAGGIALAVLGVGVNGHLAFNEPGSALDSRTRAVELTPSTRAQPGFPGGLHGPSRALTVGLGTILEAQHIVVLAHGEAKAKAVFELLQGEPNLDWPVTCLQKHEHVTVLADADACRWLTKQARG
ncbi:MAG: glucosamine-6-phosphate deaminase [Planctomycetota bacterium]|nr:glucosamine-6-phosphate deaminase [Planctomycetota bacterium]MDA1114602.1 glucosamine-6-phosphate deaminase [Planctomycetota bacterium]